MALIILSNIFVKCARISETVCQEMGKKRKTIKNAKFTGENPPGSPWLLLNVHICIFILCGKERQRWNLRKKAEPRIGVGKW